MNKFVNRLRDDLAERRERRVARHHLERDLAGYQSRSDIDDLLAAVARTEGPEAEEIRGILLRNRNRTSLFAS